jgi:hypothetical protein
MAAQGTDLVLVEREGVLYKMTLAEAVALASGGGSPGGATRELQFNNAGAFDGAANVEVDTSGHLNLVSQTAQPAPPPAGTLQLYSRSRAGLPDLEVQDPNGMNLTLQPHMGLNFVGSWMPGDSASVNVVGVPRALVGTVAHPAIASGSRLNSSRRWRTTSAAVANSVSENYSNRHHALRGAVAGEGGFKFMVRLSLTTLQASSKTFWGLANATAAFSTTFDPATSVNAVAFGFDRAVDTNWQLYHNDAAGSATKVDLGAGFPITGTINQVLTVFFRCDVGGAGIGCRMVNEDTGAVFEQIKTTDIPAAATLLAVHCYLNNGGAVAAVAYDILRLMQTSDN